ncbi:unnamed protein product [Rotaria sp. Silwood2]|nr:unnamed protein product [Rotaria sp. Silwood2]
MNSKYFHETIDVDFGYHFVVRRSVNVADVHGDLSIETLKRIYQLFNGFLVHVRSTYLTSNTSDVIQFLRLLSRTSYMILLIRDLDDEDDEEIQSAITSVRSVCSNCQIFYLPNVVDKYSDVNREKIEQLREQIFLDAVKFFHSNEQNIQKHLEQLMDTDQCRNAEQDKVFIDSIRPILIHGKEDDYPLYSLFTRMCHIRHKLAKMDPYNADFQDTKLYALHSELSQISTELEKQQRAGFQATGQAFQRFFQLVQNTEDQLNNLNLLSIELKHERDKKISCVDLTTSFYQKLSLEIHWRNAMISSKSISNSERRILIDAYHNYIDEGNSFEIIDGDNFEMQDEFLIEVMHLFHKKKFFIMSIIGPQQSGKSTLLNFLFGTLFEVREGRCTRGVYGTLVKIRSEAVTHDLIPPDYDYILLIDTEDLFSIEKSDEQYDKRLILFCLAISHLVIVNISGEIHYTLIQMLILCIQSLNYLGETRVTRPTVHFVLNEKADLNKAICEKLFRILRDILIANGLNNLIDLGPNNFHVLSTAFNRKPFLDPHGECAAISTDINFVTDVQKLCKLFVDSSFQIIRDTGDRFSIPTKWIEFANSVLQIIKKYPDLTYFKDIFEREQNNKIRQDIRNDFEQILSPTQAQLLIDREKHNSISHIQDSFQIEQEKILNELESKLEQKIVKYAVSENVRQRSFRFMRVQVASRFRSWEVSAIMAGEQDKLNKMVDDSDAELRQLAYDTTGKTYFTDKASAMEKFEMMWKNQFSCVQVKFDSETQWKQSIDLVCQLYDVLDQYALPSLDNVLAYLPFLMTLDNLDQLSKISTECISKASNINPLVPHSTNTVYTICFSDLQKPYTFLNNDALLAIYCGDKNSRTRTRSTCRLGVREDFSQEMNSNWRTTVRVSHCFELLIGRIKEIYQLKISDDEFSTEIILLQDILGTVDKLIQDVNQELSMFNFSMSKSLKSILHICAVLSTALFYYHRHKTHFNSVLMKINQNKVKWQHRFLRMVVVQENDDGNVATNLINEFSDQLRQSFELKVKEIIGTCIENELRTLNQYSIMKELDGEVYEAPNDWLMRYVLYPFQIIIERFDQRWEKIETIILQLVNISMNSHLEILAEFFRIIEAIKIALQLIGGDSFTFVDDLFESSSNDINQNLFDKKLCMATLLYQYLSGEPISTKITIKNGFTYTVQSKWQETINNMPKSSDQLKNIFRSMKTTFETYTITYIDLFLDKVINQKTTSEQALQIVMNTFVKNSCRRTRERLLIQVRGCKEQCPGCKRLCDIDHQLDNATSVGQGENRHRCQSGHQIQALGGVRYAKGNELIIVSCEQMKDEEFTITDQNSSPMCWKDFKNIHLDWDFDELNLKRRQIDVSIYIWDRIANQLCQYYENDMGFVMPNYELVQDHFILLFGYSDRSNIANDGLYGRMLRRVEGLLLTTKTDVDQDRPTLRNYLPKVIDEFIRIRIEKKRFVTDRMTLIVGGPKPICLNRVARLDEINSSQINDSISNCKKPIDFLAAFMIINDVLASIQADSKLYGLKHTIILMMDGKPDKFPFNGLRELLNNYYSTINHFWTIMLGKDDIETSKQINEIMNGTLLNINEPKDLFDVYLKIANQDADKSAACNKTSLMQSTSTLDIWTEKKTALNDPKTSIEPLSQHKKPYEEKSNTQTVPIPGIPESLIYHQIYGISFPSKREDILPNVLLAIAEQVAPNTTEDILIPLPIFSQRSIDYLPTINIKLTVEPLGFDCNQFLACLAQDIGIDRNDLVLIEARQGTVSLNTRLSVRIAIDKVKRENIQERLLSMNLPVSKNFVTMTIQANKNQSNESSLERDPIRVALENFDNTEIDRVRLTPETIDARLRMSQFMTILDQAQFEFLKKKSQQIAQCLMHAFRECSFDYKLEYALLVANQILVNQYKERYNRKQDNEKILFHGTSIENLHAIFRKNFQYHCKAKRTDNGWYGQGIYFTSSPRKALNYAKSWKFDTFAYIICSLVAVGKSLTITNMDYRGKPMHPNYDSHYVRTSPNDGEPISNEGEPFYEEFVIKDNRRILPLFIVGIRRAYHCTIWRDANIDNEVNSSILEDMRRRLSFNIYESKTSEDTLNILKSKFSDDEMNCALITNGARGGRELVIECRKLRLTIPIVVYCKKKSFHQQWATELGGREIKVTGNADETVQFVMDSLK